MIYNKLVVSLLSALAIERQSTTNSVIARYLVTHASDLDDITIRGVASACNVGTGSVSRFCREVGFDGFDELRRAIVETDHSFELANNDTVGTGHNSTDAKDSFLLRADRHAELVAKSLVLAARSVDQRALRLLVNDIGSYQKVFVCGMLKAQAAAVDLQVDLLMQGKFAQTNVSYAEQLEHIATAQHDELVVVFSYTGDYFFSRDLSSALSRLSRPRIWVVAGDKRQQPDYVYGCLLFESQQGQLSHPFQLEMISALIAQEYARRA